MITVAVNQALYATNELRLHMGRALDNGVTQAEISEIIAHTLWYSGFPTGVNAARVAAEVFAERGLPTSHPAPPTGAHRKTPTSSFRVLSRKPLTCVIYLIKLFMPKPGSEKNFRPATGA